MTTQRSVGVLSQEQRTGKITMTLFAFVLVFVSAFLHVGWNFISKNHRPSLAFYLLMSGAASMICLPFFLTTKLYHMLFDLPIRFLLFVLLSVVCEVLYIGALARGYRKGDISLVYPLMRALPVLFTGLFTIFFSIGTPLGAMVWVGLILITAGCLFMPLNRFSEWKFGTYFSGLFPVILLGALGTTGYTICDSQALGILKARGLDGMEFAFAYLFLIEFGLFASEIPLVVRDKYERMAFLRVIRKIHAPLLAGVCSSSSYALILLAMNHVTNVSYIQAFRQMSLPLSFFAGILLLKESRPLTKILGLAFILLGLLVTVFFR